MQTSVARTSLLWIPLISTLSTGGIGHLIQSLNMIELCLQLVPNSIFVMGTCDAHSVAYSLFRLGLMAFCWRCDILNEIWPKSPRALVYILINCSMSGDLFSLWACNKSSVAFVQMYPTLVVLDWSVGGLRSCPHVWWSSRSHILGLTLGVIKLSQLAGRDTSLFSPLIVRYWVY